MMQSRLQPRKHEDDLKLKDQDQVEAEGQERVGHPDTLYRCLTLWSESCSGKKVWKMESNMEMWIGTLDRIQKCKVT
jgi:hypothetical protein